MQQYVVLFAVPETHEPVAIEGPFSDYMIASEYMETREHLRLNIHASIMPFNPPRVKA